MPPKKAAPKSKLQADVAKAVGESVCGRNATYSVTRADFAGKQPTGALDTLFWVMENLGFDDVTPGDCPSSAAWFMRIWASDSPSDFYREMMRLAAKKADMEQSQLASVAWTKKKTSDIDEMLERLSDGMDGLAPPADRDHPAPGPAEGLPATPVLDGEVNDAIPVEAESRTG